MRLSRRIVNSDRSSIAFRTTPACVAPPETQPSLVRSAGAGAARPVLFGHRDVPT